MTIQIMPPTPPNNKACSRPNPPHWCKDKPNLDANPYPLVLIFLLILLTAYTLKRRLGNDKDLF
jgi:hypothetical protein